MNLSEFQELSKRTMPFNGAPSNQVEFENMLGNYAMGLVGEWFELQDVLRKLHDIELEEEFEKEGGDVLHYAVGLLALLDEKVDENIIPKVHVNFAKVEQALGCILENSKKHIYHRHELQRDELIADVYTVIRMLNQTFQTYLPAVLEMNINKLKKRYPDKWSVENSIKRVDVTE